MKFLAISGDKTNKKVRIFDSAFRALNYQQKHDDVTIKRVANWSYRLVRKQGGETTEYRLSSYKKALSIIKKEFRVLNNRETENLKWSSHDSKRITYELSFIETKPFSTDVVASYAFEMPEAKKKQTEKVVAKDDAATPIIGKNRKKWSTKKKVLVPLFSVAGAALAVTGALIGFLTDWQMVADEMKAADYTPSEKIVEITDTLRLTRKGKSIFYAAHPQLQKKGSFNMGCGSDGEDSMTSGCYYKDDDDQKEHIAIYDTEVDELRERDVYYNFVADRNVTALHEILHAAYDRLDKDEQEVMCKHARTIVGEIKSLENSLKIYSAENYCTEAFARIGSEYIVGLTGFDYEYATVNRGDLSIAAKYAADRMAEQYKIYFSYNDSLYASHQYNNHIKAALFAYVDNLYNNLSSQYSRAVTLINLYYYYPSAYNYNLADSAVKTYQKNYNTFIAYRNIYFKIFYTLDSESTFSLANL